MELHGKIVKASYSEAKRIAWRLARAKTSGSARLALALVGPPGIGKTAFARWLASALKRPLVNGSNGQSSREDFYALVPGADGSISRVPTEAWARACREPCVVMNDEVSRQGPNDGQAALLSAVQDGYVGDAQLHSDTVFILAWNDETSGGTCSVIPALINRCARFFLCPTASEVGLHFMARAKAEAKTNPVGARVLNALGAALQFRPDLVTLDPARIADAEQAGDTFASPRAWEKAALNAGDPSDPLTLMIWAATVGDGPAAAFMGVLELGKTLPTVAEVCAAPTRVPMPDKPEGSVAAIGLVIEVSKQDPDAAALYAARLPVEIRGALSPTMRRLYGKTRTSAAATALRSMLGEASGIEE